MMIPYGYKQTEVGVIPEDWDVRKIGDFTDTTAGGTPSTSHPEYWNGEILWMSSGELNNRRIHNVIGRITELGYNNSSTHMIPKNCVLIGLAGQGKTRGTVAVNYVELCTNQSIAAIFPSKEHNSEYLYQNLRSRYAELRELSSGDGGRGGLNLTIIKNFPCAFPKLQEQNRIAEALSDVDGMISSLEKLVAKYKSIKTACLQQMFPQNGETVPRMRLPGFTGAWEQRKLSEMCGTFEYGLNAAAKEFDGKNKYIRITDIDDASREFLLSDLSSPDICLDGMSKYLLSSGDIVFARTGASVGKTYIYRENDGIVYFAGFLIRAKVNQDNDAEFVFQSTLSPSYEKYIRITSQRSGQPGVNAQEYSEYDLFAPSKEEQQRIGHFLRGIDNLITLHQRKLEKIQKIKQGMMQQLLTGKIRLV